MKNCARFAGVAGDPVPAERQNGRIAQRIKRLIFPLILALLAPPLLVSAAETQYAYDEVGRLVQASRSDGNVIQYRYDGNGNLVEVTRFNSGGLGIATFAPTITHATATVLISGTGFSSTPGENAVSVGGAAAVVDAASPTLLTITVPANAQTGFITVTVGGSTASSPQQIVVRRPSIHNFTPKVIKANTAVSITGGFLNLMPGTTTFTAGPQTATINSLTNSASNITVPAGGSGRIRVQTAYGQAISAQDIYVVPNAVTPADVVATGTVEIGGAAADISTTVAGKRSVLAFDAVQGQRLSIQFEDFATTPSGYTVAYSVYSPTGSSITTNNVAASRRTIHLPTIATTGRHLLVMSSSSGHTALMTARVEEAVVLTRGVTQPVITNYPGQSKQYRFSATAGESLSIAGYNLVTNPSSVNSLWMKVNASSGEVKGFRVSTGGAGGTQSSLINLPDTGMYSVYVDPEGNTAINMSLRLAELDSTLLTPDLPTAVNFAANGDAALFRFNAVAGQTFAFNMKSQVTVPSGRSVRAYILNTSYGQIANVASNSASMSVNFTASATGVHYIDLAPDGGATMTGTTTLASGLVGNVPTDGTIMQYASTVPGQIGYLTFDAVAGQNLTLAYTNIVLTPAAGSLRITVERPNGADIFATWASRTDVPGGVKSLLNLPDTGTYRIRIDPSEYVTMSFNMRLAPLITGSLTSGAPAQPLNFPVHGDSALLDFSIADGETLALNVGSIATVPASKFVYLSILNAAGTSVADVNSRTDLTSNIRNLPAGDYRALITVQNAAAATAQVRLVPGIVMHLPADGTITQINASVPGQNAYFTFDGAITQPTSLAFTTLTLAPASGTVSFAVKRPDGSAWYDGDLYRSHIPGDQYTQLNFTANGVYAIGVDPVEHTAMGFKIRLAPLIAGTLIPGDPAQPLALPVQGDAAIYDFTIGAPRNISIALTSVVTVPASEHVRITVYNAAGTSVGTSTAVGANRTLNINNLAAGTYRVVISLPEAGTASMQVRIP